MKPLLTAVLWAMAGFTWLFGVFLVTLYFTFPSTDVATYARWRVQDSGDYLLDVAEVKPSWFGARATSVVLYSKERSGNVPLFSADQVWLGSGPLSLLRLATGGAGSVSGSFARDSGDIDFTVDLARSDKGALQPRSVRISGESLPLSALPSGMLGGGSLVGTGGLDLEADIDAPEGLSKAQGSFSLRAKDAVIEKFDLPALSGMGLGPVHLTLFDLVFEVANGKAKVATGVLQSDLVEGEISGDIVLADEIQRSRLRLKFVFSLGESLQQFKALLGQAVWEDGKFHYNLAGTFASPRFRPDRERKARAAAGGVPGAAPTVDTEKIREAGPRGVSGAELPPREDAPDMDAARAERQARREQAIAERRARLQDRRRDLMDRSPIRPPGREFLDDPPDRLGDRDDEGGPEDLDPGVDDGPPLDDGGEYEP
jgi:type II secretion system protein N